MEYTVLMMTVKETNSKVESTETKEKYDSLSSTWKINKENTTQRESNFTIHFVDFFAVSVTQANGRSPKCSWKFLFQLDHLYLYT